MSLNKNIYNITANYNFFESLLFWMRGKFDDEEFSSLTLIVPNRRSVRSFLEIVKKNNIDSKSFILPKVRAIGDLDLEDFLDINPLQKDIFFDDYFKDLILRLAEADKVSVLKYLILLAKKIKDFDIRNGFFGKNLSFDQYLNIATNFKSLFDEVEKNNIDLSKIEEIDDSDLPSHRQFVLKFINDFYFEIKNFLSKNNLFSDISYQNFIINNLCHFINSYGLKDNFIIAGSTGSISYSQQLIKSVLLQKKGHVVLQGFLRMGGVKIESHPQFNLSQLLSKLEIDIDNVKEIKNKKFLLSDLGRLNLAHNLMLPSEESGQWDNLDSDLYKKSLKDLSVIECEDEYFESKIVARALQESEFCGNSSLLITNNKNLADLVVIELAKFGIKCNIGMSNNALELPLTQLLLSVLRLLQDFDIMLFLDVVKNDLCFLSKNEYIDEVQNFEIEILRRARRDFLATSIRDDIVDKYPSLKEILDVVIKLSALLKSNVSLSSFFKEVICMMEFLTKINASTKNQH